jgi:ABC-type multidrug transport system ATPase subunit
VSWDFEADARSPASERRRARLAFVGHQPLLYDELTCAENVEFVLRLRHVQDARTRAQRWLEAFGLGSRAAERAGTLSRGLKQRLALACAFACEPELLLLDEPASGLDPDGLERLKQALGPARGRTTVLVATHDEAPFQSLATRRLSLHEGRLREDG